MWFMVKINWGLYTQLKSTVNIRFIPPKELEMLIVPNASRCKKNESHPDARGENEEKFDQMLLTAALISKIFAVLNRLLSLIHNPNQ